MHRIATWMFAGLVAIFMTTVAVAQTGSTLHRGNGAEPNTLDPHVASGTWENNIIGDMFLGLYTDDAAAKPIPGAAESHTVSDDGLVYTFKIREGHVWSDNVPVTAADFVFGMRRILNPVTAAQYASLLYPIKNAEKVNTGKLTPEELGVRAIDDKTLEITLENPAPYFIGLLTHYTSFPIPRHAYEKHGDNWIKQGNIVTNGPYTLVEWLPHDYIRLKKNPYFYDAENVAIEEVIYYPTDDNAAALRRFRAGELDVNACSSCYPATQSEWLDANMPGVRRAEITLTTTYIVFNTQKPPFDDPRVRNALSLAIERDIITDKILKAGQVPAFSLVPPGISNYVSPQMEAAAWTRDERIEKAKELLADAGYTRANPLTFEFRFRSGGDQKQYSVAIMAMWKKIGVNAIALGNEPKVHYSAVRERDFEVADAGWVADYSDAQNFLYLLQTSSGPMNYGRYSDPTFDGLMDQAAATLDIEKRAEILARAEAHMLKDQPIIPVYFSVDRNLVALHVEGWVDNTSAIHRSRYLSLKPR